MDTEKKNKTVIIIAGPTASGKTSVAIELAKYFKTEIISADSRQCFEELNIGVARPSEEELKTVKHHFIASHSIHENISAGTFEDFALQKVNELFETHDVVIMAGGTGLYIKAFCEPSLRRAFGARKIGCPSFRFTSERMAENLRRKVIFADK